MSSSNLHIMMSTIAHMMHLMHTPLDHMKQRDAAVIVYSINNIIYIMN